MLCSRDPLSPPGWVHWAGSPGGRPGRHCPQGSSGTGVSRVASAQIPGQPICRTIWQALPIAKQGALLCPHCQLSVFRKDCTVAQGVYTRVCPTALFITVRNWRQPKHSSASQRLNPFMLWDRLSKQECSVYIGVSQSQHWLHVGWPFFGESLPCALWRFDSNPGFHSLDAASIPHPCQSR